MTKKKNAFSFYLDHYVQNERQRGRFLSKRLAAEECGLKWKGIPEQEKQIFIDMARTYNSEMVQLPSIPPGSQHRDTDIEAMEEIGSGAEIKYLEDHIRDDKALRNHKLYTIHCNYYCRTAKGVYIPGEIALARFSLQNGIEATYHAVVDPGPLPLGYAFDARKNSESVHGLPVPPHGEGIADMKKIVSDIVEFVGADRDPDSLQPPFFTIEKNVVAASCILKDLAGHSRRSGLRESLNVYPVHRMFFWIKNKCVEECDPVDSGFPVISNAISEIEKDVFRYCTGLSCEFHKDMSEIYHNCSLSVVKRLVYIICDHCCHHLKIPLVRGKHIHQNSVVSKGDSSSSSSLLSKKKKKQQIRCDASSDVTSYRPNLRKDMIETSSCASSVVSVATAAGYGPKSNS